MSENADTGAQYSTRQQAAAGIQWILVIAVISTAVLEVLDSTIVNIAIPHIESTFGATDDQITWILTSYIVASIVVMPLTGYFTRRFGRRKVILSAIAGFAAFSGLCGLSWSLEVMVAFRIGQGLFGAFLIPLSQSTLFQAFPKEKRGQAMALFGLGVVVAPVLGPTVGAYLTDTFVWRMVFYVNLPIAALAFLLLLGEMPKDQGQKVETDWTGLILMALMVGAIQFILDTGEQRDWYDSKLIQVATATAILAGGIFVVRGIGKRDNIVDLNLFGDRSFLAANLTIMGFGIGMFGTIAILPTFVQTLLGYPILEAGYLFIPRGIASGFSMVVTGSLLVGRFDPRLLVSTGILLTAGGSFMYADLNLDASFWNLAWPGVLSGLGLGLVFVPLSTVAFDRISNDKQDEASGLYAVTRQFGSSIGIAVVSALLVQRMAFHYAVLGENITPFSQAARDYLIPYGVPLDSAAGAEILAGELSRQASLMAYIDVFTFIGWSSLVTLPLVFLMRKPQRGGAPTVAH
ncbi:DHA2 family efflux MFS transporter permease subunit [Fulvimarina endophytica]|uniref:DHA2 family efflux MFS transporter permease subunit n=1 Tax=Fulvimarina endophytica TaxID=2293836 RepID=A0A371X1C6_9HYPH|nr:DHA2 family efflux MFS transporter permease subunit [Fulvimarina endophytica]RFC63026.1 DHA2 family efflux MFS transporter permease subunit [Fulvimarina endophytica]